MFGRRKHDRDRHRDDRDVVAERREVVREEPVPVRRRYGGFDLGASLSGMLAAIGMTVLLAGIVAGGTTLGYQYVSDATDEEVSAGGVVAGAIVLVIAFFIGGWVAGRMARYSGAANGLAAGIWFVVVLAVAGALGAWADEDYDFVAEANLPDWFSGDATAESALTAIVVAVAALLFATLGGALGARYHRHADDALVEEVRGRRDIDLGDRDADRDVEPVRRTTRSGGDRDVHVL